jgi:hypothetical protein
LRGIPTIMTATMMAGMESTTRVTPAGQGLSSPRRPRHGQSHLGGSVPTTSDLTRPPKVPLAGAHGSKVVTFRTACPTYEHFHLGAVYFQTLPRRYSIRMGLFVASDCPLYQVAEYRVNLGLALTIVHRTSLRLGKQSRCSSE